MGDTETSAPPEQPPKSEPPPTPIHNLSNPFNGNGSRPASPIKDQSTPAPPPIKTSQIASLTTTRTPTPLSIPPDRVKQPQTTREILSHIAWLSEEVLRASEEKVNLAQAAYDSVRSFFCHWNICIQFFFAGGQTYPPPGSIHQRTRSLHLSWCSSWNTLGPNHPPRTHSPRLSRRTCSS